MGVYFRKRIKIAPGINLNVGKKSTSISIGPRGAKLNISKRGVYGSTSIPGTGIYTRNKIASFGSTKPRNNYHKKSDSEIINENPLQFIIIFLSLVLAIFIPLMFGGSWWFLLIMPIIGLGLLMLIGWIKNKDLKNKSSNIHEAVDPNPKIENFVEQRTIDRIEKESDAKMAYFDMYSKMSKKSLLEMSLANIENKQKILNSAVDVIYETNNIETLQIKYESAFDVVSWISAIQALGIKFVNNSEIFNFANRLSSITNNNILRIARYKYSEYENWKCSISNSELINKETARLVECVDRCINILCDTREYDMYMSHLNEIKKAMKQKD